MRLGLFGGTFNPPHVGHLLAASDAVEQLDLERLIFVPVCRQPLKATQELAAPEARLEMLRRMLGGDARFSVDTAEIDRGGLSYTVDTLRLYATRHPQSERFLVIGADAVRNLESWREPAQVVSLAKLAVLTRVVSDCPEMTEAELRSRVRELAGDQARDPVVVHTRRIDVSSSEVRSRVRAGKPLSGFVVDAVARYVQDSGLYR